MSGPRREPRTPAGRLRIKLCGVRRVEDALLCAGAGADEIGVVLATQSRRCIPLALALEIRAALPPQVALVGVFLDPTETELNAATAAVSFSALQLHGSLPPRSALQTLQLPLYRALQIADADSLRALAGLEGFARLLLDGPRGGGAGSSFDWRLARQARDRFAESPIFLAGGLAPENVAEAIASARPDGVDVASGIEGADGFKDPQRVRAFIAAARGAGSQ